MTYSPGKRLQSSTVLMIVMIDVTSVVMMIPYCYNMQVTKVTIEKLFEKSHLKCKPNH